MISSFIPFFSVDIGAEHILLPHLDYVLDAHKHTNWVYQVNLAISNGNLSTVDDCIILGVVSSFKR